MNTEELQDVISVMLNDYLNDSPKDVNSILAKRAILAFQEYVHYPPTWTDEEILADMTAHRSCICDLALYEAIQQGAEFQSMHIESGLYRMWQSKGSVYTTHGVVPYATT